MNTYIDINGKIVINCEKDNIVLNQEMTEIAKKTNNKIIIENAYRIYFHLEKGFSYSEYFQFDLSKTNVDYYGSISFKTREYLMNKSNTYLGKLFIYSYLL